MKDTSYQPSAISRQQGQNASGQPSAPFPNKLKAESRELKATFPNKLKAESRVLKATIPNKLKADSRKLTAISAFTLIEILTVIVIIMILAGLVVGAAKYAQTKAARSRAQAEIATMETALESYKNDNGAYPLSTTTRATLSGPAGSTEVNNSGSLYTALAGTLSGSKVYMTFKPNQTATKGGITYIADPFGSPYNYYCILGAVDQMNSVTFDLWSYGPIGTNGAVDMITNWKQ